MADGYEVHIAPGSSSFGAGATPDMFGAGIGRTIEAAGTQLEALQKRRQLEDASADAGVKIAGLQGDMAQATEDARTNANPGGAGHTQTVLQNFDTSFAPVLDSITDPRVRDSVREQGAQMRARLQGSESAWEAGKRVAKMGTDFNQTAQTYAGNLAVNPDPAARNEAHDNIEKMAAGFQGAMNPDDLAKLAHENLSVVDEGYVKGGILQDPHKMQAILQSGALNDTLGEKVAPLLASAQAQIDHQASQARAALSLQKGQVNQALDLLDHRQKNGEILTDNELASAQSAAQVIGEPVKAYDFGAMRQRNAINVATQSWLPQQYQDRINALAAKGPAATTAEQTELHQLQEIAPKRTAEFTANPGAWAATNGAPPPPIDATGNGFADRAQWRQGVQSATGHWTPTLSKDEAAPHIDAIQHGPPSQQLAEANYINSWGAEMPNVLRQLVPDQNGAFAQATRLAGPSMRDALNGPDALKALGGGDKAFHVDKTLGELPPDDLFASMANTALMGRAATQPSFGAGVRQNADAIYASVAARNGWPVFHAGEYQRSVQKAAGAIETPQGWAGGIGAWNGAPMLLPPRTPQAAFDNVFSRASAAGLVTAAGNAAPVTGNRPMTADELRSATPVSVGDGLYRFRVGNAYIRSSRGGAFTLDFGVLAKQPRAASAAPRQPLPTPPIPGVLETSGDALSGVGWR